MIGCIGYSACLQFAEVPAGDAVDTDDLVRCAGGRGVWAALQEVFSTQHGERVRSTSTVRRLAALTAQQRLKVLGAHMASTMHFTISPTC